MDCLKHFCLLLNHILNKAKIENAKKDLCIMHPLPRVNEIDQDVDDNPKAYYFQQAQNGLYARQAIICRALNIDIKEVQKS